jgi:hypothetical protein
VSLEIRLMIKVLRLSTSFTYLQTLTIQDVCMDMIFSNGWIKLTFVNVYILQYYEVETKVYTNKIKFILYISL